MFDFWAKKFSDVNISGPRSCKNSLNFLAGTLNICCNPFVCFYKVNLKHNLNECSTEQTARIRFHLRVRVSNARFQRKNGK